MPAVSPCQSPQVLIRGAVPAWKAGGVSAAKVGRRSCGARELRVRPAVPAFCSQLEGVRDARVTGVFAGSEPPHAVLKSSRASSSSSSAPMATGKPCSANGSTSSRSSIQIRHKRIRECGAQRLGWSGRQAQGRAGGRAGKGRRAGGRPCRACCCGPWPARGRHARGS